MHFHPVRSSVFGSFCLLFFLLTQCLPALPAAPATLALSLEEAAAYALAHNPALAAASLRIQEARGRLLQSGRLSRPELEWEWSRNPVSHEGASTVSLLQRFPLTARLRHEKNVSRHELAAAEAEVRDARRKLATEVRSASIKMLALDAHRELRSKQLATSRELASFLGKRLASGEASSIEVSQTELETRQIQVELLQLSAGKAALLGELRPLLGVGAHTRVTLTGTLPAPRTRPGPGAAAPPAAPPETRPDVQAARERAAAAVSLALQHRASRWEDIGLGLSYTREQRVDEPYPLRIERLVGLRLNLPLPVWNSHSGRIQEAEAAAARARREYEALQLGAENEAAAAKDELHALEALLSDLETAVLPKAVHIEAQLREAYASGQSPLNEVLRARARSLELQRLRLDALRDYHLARARFLAATTAPAAPAQPPSSTPRKGGGK